MQSVLSVVLLQALVVNRGLAFVPPQQHHRVLSSVRVSAAETSDVKTTKDTVTKTKPKTLGLLTFDLDDTLYPITPVIDEANAAFARAMGRFGYEGLTPMDIVQTAKLMREEIAEEDPKAAAILTHTEIRELAIRREMENIMLAQKLKETADDWATPVSALADVVVAHAKKWSRTAVSPSIINAVLTAWEMERHHAAERHLYPEVLDVLKQIKEEHPDVIIGAVTDGRANPMLMTFTLAPYFDFCMSWEDDQGGRSKFFQELGAVDGEAQLSWIYDAAFEKYKGIREVKDAIKAEAPPDKESDTPEDRVWIHVGDDLAYDVGGAANSGAKTILVELADKYEQTARLRFDPDYPQPNWSTSLASELEQRRVMNKAAEEKIGQKIRFFSQFPGAVKTILENA